jgi:DNA-binding transcriptional MerR regulator
MRIAELSRRSGVPVPTVKYYLREGLLPAGELSSPNQARYDERHLRRLRLVRALLDVGRLPIAAIRELLADLDRPDPDLHHALGRALRSSTATRQPIPPNPDPAAPESADPESAAPGSAGPRSAAPRSAPTGAENGGAADGGLRAARQEADDLITRHGWQVSRNAPARRAAAEVIAALRQLGVDDLVDKIDDYADAAEAIATTDLEIIGSRRDPEEAVYGAVVGTILGDALIAALRRLAQENASAKLFHQGVDSTGS